MRKILFFKVEYVLFFLKLLLVLFLMWGANILFLNKASNIGTNGWDDWRYIFYFDINKALDLRNIGYILNSLRNVYDIQQLYTIGLLKTFLGLNERYFQLASLLFKALAGLAAAYLVLRLSKDKLFATLTALFFLIFPSTAGILIYVVLSINYLAVASVCLAVLFYVKSTEKEKYLFIASLFFFLALCVGPARVYLIIPVPLVIELFRLLRAIRRNNKSLAKSIWIFSQRIIIFYLPLYIFFKGSTSSERFQPFGQLLLYKKRIEAGNLYLFSFPFQMISALFIDQQILKELLQKIGVLFFTVKNQELRNILIINIFLFIASSFLGFVIKGKKRMWSFSLLVITFLLITELLFYWFAQFNMRNGSIPLIDLEGRPYLQLLFNPSFYQAMLGSFPFILTIILGWEWLRNQRANKILMITVLAGVWLSTSMIMLFLTNYRWEMIMQSYDRYILISSLGAVIFTAGIFTLSFRSLGKIKNIGLRISVFSLLVFMLLLISWEDYKLLEKVYYDWTEVQGGGSYWQNIMHQRFVKKIGKENLQKPILLFMDNQGGLAFNEGSFIYPIRYRIYYDEKGNFISNKCKAVITDFQVLKEAFVVRDGKKGFSDYCMDSYSGFTVPPTFYFLDDFYAYKIVNKEFIDIKKEVVSQLENNKVE